MKDMTREERESISELKNIPPHKYRNIVDRAKKSSVYQSAKFDLALEQLMMRAYRHFNAELLQAAKQPY